MPGAYIALEGGEMVQGRCRSPGRARGELVFTTAYTGYEESFTDPSYEGQVLTFSYPLIGNYGVRPERFESDSIHPSAIIARELTHDVTAWLNENDVPAIDALDTRDIVTDIRTGGAMQCGIAAGPDASPEAARNELARSVPIGDQTSIGAKVSVHEAKRLDSSGDGPTIVLVDCGVKQSIISALRSRGGTVLQVPYDTSPGDVVAHDPDILFISNGPGDPANFSAAERLVKNFAGELPIAGICLGQQIIARALGGTTEKMEFGHRGVNQPVLDYRSDRVVMTTQNHGYTVADPGELEVSQINVNDETPEGLMSKSLQIKTRQYHPEAHPGPLDSMGFFDDVLQMDKGQQPKLVAD